MIQSISKLAKNHPARAQILSASLGYTVDKLLGGHGLEGASIAQDGTKWNRYGPRRWFNGEVTVRLIGALQTKVVNKEPIDFKDIKDVKFSILKDGKEEELWIGDLPDRYIVWVADQNGLGQDYLVNKAKEKLVPIYGDFKSQHIGVKDKKNVIYTGYDTNLKNELHIHPTDEESVPLGDIIRYKPVREFLGGFSEGFGDALKSDIEGQIEFLEELIFNPIGVANDIQQLIKELSHFSNMQKYTEQLYKITNEIYDIAWGKDHKRKGVLLGQATEIVASIIFSPDKIKLSKVKFLNQVHKIMEFTPKSVKFEKAFETAVAMGNIVEEEKTLIKVNKRNAIENKVESIEKEAKVIAKDTKTTKANKNVDKNIEMNKKESPKQSTTETASSTTNTTSLSDSPDIYRNGEQYKPGMKTRQLKENIVYESKGYYYQTDELGRIKAAQGDLRLEDGVRNNRDQLKAGGEDRLPGDHGGHLIARIFGGSGELDNLVAMDKIVNTIEYRELEKAWENALKDGKTVNIEITLDYTETNKRPTGFNVVYKIGDFKDKTYFSNGG